MNTRHAGDTADGLLDRSVLLVTGKGGVGKSTVAASLARLAARRGKQVLLLELESVSRVGPLFGLPAVGPEPTKAGPNLWVSCLHASDSLRFFATSQLKVASLVNLALRNKSVESFFQAVPAMKPILFMFQLWRTEVDHGRTGDRRWDLIVCDLPTSGFVVGMYAIPQTLSHVFRLGPLAGYGQGMREMLADPARTGLVLVTLPEELPVVETLELRESLRQRHGVEAAAVVLNGAMPQAMSAEDLAEARATLQDSDQAAWLWAAELLQGRHARAQAMRTRLEAELPGRVLTLPFLFRRHMPLAAIDELASALAGEGS